jgi:3'(2'), 5'-bisphosphate nucleotidase
VTVVFPRPAKADPDAVARALCEAALAGCAAILACCKDGRPKAETKTDGSPVTLADLSSDLAVRLRLQETFPGTAIISEEHADGGDPGQVFILVDPLDGTREFVADGDQWCVAIALIVEGRAVAGAIAAPRLNRAWFGANKAFGCDLTEDLQIAGEPVIVTSADRHGAGQQDAGPVILVSRFHGEGRSDRIAEQLLPSRKVFASSAIKFGLIAEGSADAYIRCGPTMEWDVAAGDAILTAAGGRVCGLDGTSLTYGMRAGNYLNPPFVAASSAELAEAACAVAQRES